MKAGSEEILDLQLDVEKHERHTTFCPYASSPTGMKQMICTDF